MKNQLTTVWGVVPGRQVGQITKRFHKTRTGTDAERAIAKAQGVTLKEARRILRFAQAANARKDGATKQADCIALELARQHKAMQATVSAQDAETQRAARVAAYLKTLEN